AERAGFDFRNGASLSRSAALVRKRVIEVAAIHFKHAGCVVGWMAILPTRLAVDRQSLAKYVHADRDRYWHCVSLQCGGNAGAADFPAIIRGSRQNRHLF